MKTFTSLFALLSCLSVYNAQANVVTIYVDASTVNNPRYWYWGTTSDPTNFSDRPYINDLPTQVINGVTFHKLELTPDSNNKVSVKFTNGDNEGQTNEIGNLSAPNSYYYTYTGNDNYSVPVITLGISSSADDWRSVDPTFDYKGNNTWSCIWDLSNATNDVEFKLRPNLIYYAGISNNEIQAADGWIEGTDNIKLNHSYTGCKKYQITAIWNPNIYTENGWIINIKGILELSNDIAFETNGAFTAAEATYTRPSFDYHWGTLCLPFEIKNTYEGVTFYQLSSVTETSMKFTPIEGTIAAGTPVAFKLDEPGELNITESNVTVVADPTTAGISNWTMKGTFQRKTLSGIYFIYNDEYHYGTNITLKPYRGWFETTTANGAPFRIEIEEEQSLQFVEQEDGTVMATFDLHGRKLDNARKGLVIENGKIIMIK